MNLLASSTLSALAFFAISHGAAADEKKAIAFIEQHCVGCHEASEKKGGLDLAALNKDFTNADTFAQWVKVLDRTASGEMPPKKKARPAAVKIFSYVRPGGHGNTLRTMLDEREQERWMQLWTGAHPAVAGYIRAGRGGDLGALQLVVRWGHRDGNWLDGHSPF